MRRRKDGRNQENDTLRIRIVDKLFAYTDISNVELFEIIGFNEER
ncbi:hypothetical protein [Candidatus Clostridium stratigraminis]|uniref:Uncharacterized protein n=1 Tax=Candidatus Clostridium stratigraminis TaxID=3381661 RepID=A0ABW8T8D6_9CLOT